MFHGMNDPQRTLGQGRLPRVGLVPGGPVRVVARDRAERLRDLMRRPDLERMEERFLLSISVTGQDIFPTEGQTFSGQVGTLTDTSFSTNSTNYSVEISWGDGTSSTGSATFSGTSAGGSQFAINGTHVYADEGTENASILVTDNATSPPETASGPFTATVNDADTTLTGRTGSSFGRLEGQPLFNGVDGVVASFDNPNSGTPATDFIATIDWGDGTTTPGTVVPRPASTITGLPAGFDVRGQHIYTEESNPNIGFAMVVRLSDDPPSTATATVTNSVFVGEIHNLTPGAPATLSATERQPLVGSVGTFTDFGNPFNNAGDFTIEIDWGDGMVTDGTVTALGTVMGTISGTVVTGEQYRVDGSHTYADEGTFPIHFRVIDENGVLADTSATPGRVSIAEGDELTPAGASVTTPLTQFPQGIMAQFTDTDAFSRLPSTNTADDFVATIDWGDGTTTAGTVSGSGPTGNGQFRVTGSHTYAAPGQFMARITLADDPPGTASATQTLGVTVSPLIVRNTNNDGPNSLRGVIAEATALKGGTITFAIPGPGPFTIHLATPLPPITVPVTIDGTTQPGFAGTPIVVLDGSGAGSNADGLTLDGGNSTVKGLVINGFGNAGVVLEVQGGDAVEGNDIGTDVTGTSAVPNFQGVVILGTSNNRIGGTTLGQRNLISGNTSTGIQIFNNQTIFDAVDTPPPPLQSTPATNNVVQDNLIGTDAGGTAPLPNGQGIFINDASDNTIGGAAPGLGNVISGNKSIGIQVLGEHATGNAILGNAIAGNPLGVYIYAPQGANFTDEPAGNVRIRPLADGPNVERVVPRIQGGQVTGADVIFTTYMNRDRAQYTPNYIISLAGGANAFNPVTSAVYDSVNRTVHLTFTRPMSPNTTYQIRIIGTGPNGLTDRVGNHLDGNLLLPPIRGGSDFATTFRGTTELQTTQVTIRPTRARKMSNPKGVQKPHKISGKAVDALLGQGHGIRARRAPIRHR
jgi:Bacterial Ig-like domain